jgi:hypothetical protein
LEAECWRWRYALEAEGCIGGRWRWMEQTELVGGRRTDQNMLEAGRVVRASEHVASG